MYILYIYIYVQTLYNDLDLHWSTLVQYSYNIHAVRFWSTVDVLLNPRPRWRHRSAASWILTSMSSMSMTTSSGPLSPPKYAKRLQKSQIWKNMEKPGQVFLLGWKWDNDIWKYLKAAISTGRLIEPHVAGSTVQWQPTVMAKGSPLPLTIFLMIRDWEIPWFPVDVLFNQSIDSATAMPFLTLGCGVSIPKWYLDTSPLVSALRPLRNPTDALLGGVIGIWQRTISCEI